jgi:hypothetical protein
MPASVIIAWRARVYFCKRELFTTSNSTPTSTSHRTLHQLRTTNSQEGSCDRATTIHHGASTRGSEDLHGPSGDFPDPSDRSQATRLQFEEEDPNLRDLATCDPHPRRGESCMFSHSREASVLTRLTACLRWILLQANCREHRQRTVHRLQQPNGSMGPPGCPSF